MFPDAKVGQLASYRTLLVKNRHLATVAQRLEIHKYLLMGDSQQNGSGKHKQSPGPSPDSGSATPEQGTVACMDTEAHTSANTLEAVLGAVYLDSGLAATQLLMARLFFPEEVRASLPCCASLCISKSIIGTAEGVVGLPSTSIAGGQCQFSNFPRFV